MLACLLQAPVGLAQSGGGDGDGAGDGGDRTQAGAPVSEVSLAGKFKGTPSGACVIAVVKTARFDRFKNGPIVIQYPLLLR